MPAEYPAGQKGLPPVHRGRPFSNQIIDRYHISLVCSYPILGHQTILKLCIRSRSLQVVKSIIAEKTLIQLIDIAAFFCFSFCSAIFP